MSLERQYSRSLTLKESYQKKILIEKVQRLDERVLVESYAQLLVEELSKDDLKKASEMLQRLRVIASESQKLKITSLYEAIKAASEDLNDQMQGGAGALLKKASKGVLSKITGVKIEDNALVKCTTLLNSIESGFSTLEDVVNNNLGDTLKDPKNKKLSIENLIKFAVGGEKREEAGKDSSPEAPGKKPKQEVKPNDPRVEKIKKRIINTIVNAFSKPEQKGFMAKLMSLFGSKIPYVKDSKKFATEIISVPYADLEKLIGIVTSDPLGKKLSQLSQDVATTSKEGGGEKSQRTGTPQVVQTLPQMAQVIVRGVADQKNKQPSDKSLTAAAEDPKKVTEKFVKYIADKSKQTPEVVGKILQALIKSGHLKSEVKITEGLSPVGLTKNIFSLTISDVQHARNLFLESGYSPSVWVDLIFEGGQSTSKWLTMINNGDFKSVEDLKKAFEEKAGTKGYPHGGPETKQNLIKKLEENLASPSDDKKQDEIPPEAIQKAAEEIKGKNLDFDSLKGRAEAIKFLKEKFKLPDVKKAKSFFDEKISPILQAQNKTDKSSEKENKDGKSGKDPLGSSEAEIRAAKSLEDLKKILLKLDPEQVIGSQEAFTVKYTLDALNKIPEDFKPKDAKDIADRGITDNGKLRTKVLDLLRGDDKKKSNDKHAKVIDSIKDSLKDVKPEEIRAVLDALPEYLLAEARRRKLLG